MSDYDKADLHQDTLHEAVADAVAAERERAAKVCERRADDKMLTSLQKWEFQQLAEKIRKAEQP